MSPSYLKCSLCPTVFANRHGDVNQLCPICNSGRFQTHYFPKKQPPSGFVNHPSSDTHQKALPPKPSSISSSHKSEAEPTKANSSGNHAHSSKNHNSNNNHNNNSKDTLPSKVDPWEAFLSSPSEPAKKTSTVAHDPLDPLYAPKAPAKASTAKRPPPSEPLPAHIREKYSTTRGKDNKSDATATTTTEKKVEPKKADPPKKLPKGVVAISEPKFLRHEKPDFSPFARLQLNHITDPQREAYQRDFLKADQDHDGYVGPQDAKIYFNQFGVDKKLLSKIWVLSDVGQDSQLDQAEFEVAMHLIRCAQTGILIPDMLPEELEPWVPPTAPARPPAVNPNPTETSSNASSGGIAAGPRDFEAPSSATTRSPPVPAKSSENALSLNNNNSQELNNTGTLREKMPASSTEGPSRGKAPPPIPTTGSLRGKAPPPVPATRGGASSSSPPSSGPPPVPPRDPNRPPPESFAHLREGPRKEAPRLRPQASGRDLAQSTEIAFQKYSGNVVHSAENTNEDYLSSLPPKLSTAVRFLKLMVEEADWKEAHEMCASSAAHLTPSKLRELTHYYASNDFLWYCEAFAFHRESAVEVFVPLYIPGGNHQAQLVVAKEGITDVQFESYNSSRWASGSPDRYLIAPPRQIVTKSGGTIDVYTAEQEAQARSNPDVPCQLRIGKPRVWKLGLSTKLNISKMAPTLLQKGPRDNKLYHVFGEINTNEHSVRVDPSCFYREFWIPKNDTGLPICYVRDRNGDLVKSTPYVETISGALEPYETWNKSKKRSEVVQKAIPDIFHYYFAWPIPQETPSTVVLPNTVRDNPQGYMTKDHRAYVSKIDSHLKEITISFELMAQIRPVEFCPVYKGHTYTPVATVSEEEQQRALANPPDIDFLDVDFVNALQQRGLLKLTSELEYAFAQRIFIHLCKALKIAGQSTPKQTLFATLSSGKGDRVAVTRLLAGVLRASKVPARLVYGRLCRRTVTNEHAPDRQEEVICEFFSAAERCWIPCDIANFVDTQNPALILAGFGRAKSDFFAWSVEKTLADIPIFGPRVLNPTDFTILFDHTVISSEWTASLQ